MLSDGVVSLREWHDEDAEWYAEAVRDPEIQRYTSEPENLTVEEVRASIAALTDHRELVGFVICDATTGERVGNIGMRHEQGTGEIGYWIAAAARGHGLASRAVRLMSEWAMATLGLTELRLWTHSDNAASGRVAEQAGFQRAPEHDQVRTVKGRQWDTTAYRRIAPASR